MTIGLQARSFVFFFRGSIQPTGQQTLQVSCRYCLCVTCTHSFDLCFVCFQPRKKCGESTEANENMGLPDLCRYCEFENCTHCSSKCVVCGKPRRRCKNMLCTLETLRIASR
ncbi:uncharacterized protein LOC117114122 [Anneissia japonica]|uniref:uncharacterized protein LOC117114122 n=1 Tax=Anneissia japonica TaxID=1529436 RepID=UPI00142591D9|nr:uncharacterized protein LOC117114122 [Anneissia japonica]